MPILKIAPDAIICPKFLKIESIPSSKIKKLFIRLEHFISYSKNKSGHYEHCSVSNKTISDKPTMLWQNRTILDSFFNWSAMFCYVSLHFCFERAWSKIQTAFIISTNSSTRLLCSCLYAFSGSFSRSALKKIFLSFVQ